MLEQLYLAKYQFILQAKEDLALPTYKGSVFRGGFGSVFRQLCCVNKKEKNCLQCLLKNKCAYVYIFETLLPENSSKFKSLREIPHPFVIEPPNDNRKNYYRGDLFNFNLLLFGKAVDYLTYFIFTFKELGNLGIGRKGRRGKYCLKEIFNFQDEKIYDFQDETIKNINSKITFTALSSHLSLIPHYLSLSFLTPTRIKYQNDLVVKPEFHILIRSLLHRISALSYFHCNEELKVDFKTLISDAEKVRIKDSNLR
ncbi:MAG TPA: hypothetical protein DHV62_02665, partial [Elusimicrobia bacterium]|nr:hypothetical protein [Elusimicrobiota bacterium]